MKNILRKQTLFVQIALWTIFTAFIFTSCNQKHPTMLPPQKGSNASDDINAGTSTSFENIAMNCKFPEHYPSVMPSGIKRDSINVDPSAIADLFNEHIINGEFRTIEGSNKSTTIIFTTIPSERLTVKPGAIIFYTNFGINIFETFKYNVTLPQCNLDRFKQTDLSFATREEAAQRVITLMKGLGFEVCANYSIYSLTLADLAAEQQRLINEGGTYIKQLDPDDLFKGSGQSDVYYMVFSIGYENIPFLQRHFDFETINAGLRETVIQCILNEDGIKYLSMSGYMVTDDSNIEKKEIIRCSDALAKLDEMFDLVILDSPIVIDNISLELFPFPDEVVPAWVFQTSRSGVTYWYYINAFTGKQII